MNDIIHLLVVSTYYLYAHIRNDNKLNKQIHNVAIHSENDCDIIVFIITKHYRQAV